MTRSPSVSFFGQISGILKVLLLLTRGNKAMTVLACLVKDVKHINTNTSPLMRETKV